MDINKVEDFCTVKELRERLENVPDDYVVMVERETGFVPCTALGTSYTDKEYYIF